MDKQQLKAAILIGNSRVTASLEVYFFVEDGMRIAYCPSLNLSAYGQTLEEAKSEFSKILKEHLEYCISKKTLAADLEKHGWTVRQKEYIAPLTTDMLRSNATLRDIINNRSYKKAFVPATFSRVSNYRANV